MKKKNNKKGFTLAELLIVVAIIAVLTAIAIPVFNKQLEKSRDATSIANIRSAYAEAQTTFLMGEGDTHAVYATTTDGITVTIKAVKIMSKVEDDWNGLGADLPFTVPDDPGTDGNMDIVFTYKDNELFSVDWATTGGGAGG